MGKGRELKRVCARSITYHQKGSWRSRWTREPHRSPGVRCQGNRGESQEGTRGGQSPGRSQSPESRDGGEPAEGNRGTVPEGLQVPPMTCVLTAALNPMDLGPPNPLWSQTPGGPQHADFL